MRSRGGYRINRQHYGDIRDTLSTDLRHTMVENYKIRARVEYKVKTYHGGELQDSSKS